MWPEVERVKGENRHELVLAGKEVSQRIAKNGLDVNIFTLTGLNYLAIYETNLGDVPEDICKLSNLQSLVLHSNKLGTFNVQICTLEKLKLLDLSKNNLKTVPSQLNDLVNITSLNLSYNQIESFPKLAKTTKLTVLNLAKNNLKDFPAVTSELLSELILNDNQIEFIPNEINSLSLKVLELNQNQIKILPGELALCTKLKTLELKNNPITDRRLLKLIEQCRTKQIVDYVKAHGPKVVVEKPKKQAKKEEEEENEDNFKYSIKVLKCLQDPKIVVDDGVKTVREFLVACLVKNIQFEEDSFKKFIQLQNKLHDSVCSKRNLATIATHDFSKLPPGDLHYTSLPPNELQIHPLNRTTTISGADLFTKLQTEAHNLRKEKKRNTYSGIHKYLYLIEGHPKYPCLLNHANTVISFPPITNSETSKIEIGTKTLLLEVTSSQSLQTCKHVMETLLKEMVLSLGRDLEVAPIKTVDNEGRLKVLFPSKADLATLQGGDIKIVRTEN